MSDIVKRLHTYVACDGGDLADVAEAADEITSLRAQVAALEVDAEIEGLREASKSALLVLCALRDANDWHRNMVKDIDFAIEAARAALGDKS